MDGDAGIERWELKGSGWKSHICPRRLITNDTRMWLKLYALYKSGHLFNAGGVNSQPALYLNAMTRIESLVEEATRPENSGNG